MKRLRYQNGPLDEIDTAILRLLIKDARASTAEIARSVGLSPPSVAERIRRLEDAGVISGYTLVVDPAAFGLPVSAWIRIRPVPGQLAKVAKLLGEIPEIVECDRVTGEDCFVARACLGSVRALETLIDRLIPLAMTNTAIIQSTPVQRRLPPLPGISDDQAPRRRKAST